MYLSIDIGGTKTLIALFSKKGRVIRRRKFKTARALDEFLDELVSNLQMFLEKPLKAVTVAIPGQVRVEQKNCSVRLGNRDWGWFNLSETLNKLFNCPVYYENDANLAAIYESDGLTGRTLFLTFSTGIGGGLAENGKIIDGELEPGHKVYEYKGELLEWEDIAAASALEKAYAVKQATDLRGKDVMMDIAARMALGLDDVVTEYRPDTVVIGGPMGKIFRKFVKYLPNLGVQYKRPKRPLESVIYGCYIFSKNQE